MMRVFLVDAAALANCGEYASIGEAQTALENLGLTQNMPFLLDDGGAPLREANRWLLSLPTYGCQSPRTWKGYADDVCEWANYLEQGGKKLLEATRENIADFHAARRMGDQGGRIIGAASWNRKMAALDSFYQWAVEEELITQIPFSYRSTHYAGSDGRSIGVKRNLAMEATGRAHATLKWLEEDQLRFFLDVGLSGLNPDGTEDKAFKGRNAPRNRAFGDLLATVGLRSQEASHLLCVELPEVSSEPVRFVRMDLPGGVTKGGKDRAVLVPPATLRALEGYVRMERATVAARATWKPTRPLITSELSHTDGKVDGRKRKWANLGVDDRARLLTADGLTAGTSSGTNGVSGVSPLLFLSRGGQPMTDWQEVFEAATRRCREHQRDFPAVHPHTLRHTYAVTMLRWLIEQAASAVQRKVAETDDGAWAGYWRAHDPLITLRDLMGHRSVATTQVYLHAIDATRLYATIMDDLDEDEAEADAEGKETETNKGIGEVEESDKAVGNNNSCNKAVGTSEHGGTE